MSIPLIQKPDKDNINTSLIAIKRQIERINMLLGLSNSEEIDTSVFATKEELQQAVTDLQPVDTVALNNVHSVSSNAVAECLSYSTTEHKTGAYYKDGKPIWEISVRCTLPSGLDNWYVIYDASALNIDTFISAEGTAKNNNQQRMFSLSDFMYNYPETNKISMVTKSWISIPVDCTFQYTKTTD